MTTKRCWREGGLQQQLQQRGGRVGLYWSNNTGLEQQRTTTRPTTGGQGRATTTLWIPGLWLQQGGEEGGCPGPEGKAGRVSALPRKKNGSTVSTELGGEKGWPFQDSRTPRRTTWRGGRAHREHGRGRRGESPCFLERDGKEGADFRDSMSYSDRPDVASPFSVTGY